MTLTTARRPGHDAWILQRGHPAEMQNRFQVFRGFSDVMQWGRVNHENSNVI
jgi:hypothetical protein